MAKGSIRSKLNFFLIAVPTLAIVAYWFVVQDVIKEDKKAYIFENMGLRSEKIESDYGLLKKTVDNAFEIMGNQEFSEEKILSQSLASAKFKKTDGEVTIVRTIGEPKLSEYLINSHAKHTEFPVFVKIENKDYFLSKKDDPENEFTLVIADANYLVNNIRSSKAYGMSLISGKTVLLANDEYLPHAQKAFPDPTASLTIKEIGDETDGLILAQKKMDDKIVLRISISSEKAYTALTYLKQKSILFTIILFSCSIIVSVFITRRLTKYLHMLWESTQQIITGNFETNLDIKSGDEIQDLGDAFTKMSKTIRELLSELRMYNEKLEDLVKERTSQLNDALALQTSMMDSVESGFMVFNQDAQILDTVSKSTSEHFECEVKGKKVIELLMDEDTKREELQGLTTAFFENFLDFEEYTSFLPTSLKTPSGKTIRLKYNQLNYEKFKACVVVTEDITQEVLLQEEMNQKRQLVEKLVTISSNRSIFTGFLSRFQQFAEKALKEEIDCDSIYREAHTLKATSNLLNLVEMSQNLHTIEEVYGKNKNENFSLHEAKRTIFAARETLNLTCDQVKPILGKNFDKEVIDVLKSDLRRHLRLLAGNKHGDNVRAYIVNTFFTEKIHQSLKHLGTYLTRQSYLRGLPSSELVLNGEDFPIISDNYKEFFEDFIHLINNTIAHNENYYKAENKPLIIEVSTFNNGPEIEIIYQDNGAGIDPVKVARIAVEKGIISQEEVEQLSNKEIMSLIFADKFTSASQVSSISGRAVGLKALVVQVKNYHGTMTLLSEPCDGFRLSIKLPHLKEMSLPSGTRTNLKIA